MSRTLTNPLNVFASAPKPPQSTIATAVMIGAIIAMLLSPILICFADEADARARTAGAKVAFEISDQAVLPLTVPNVDLSIRKIAGSAPVAAARRPLDFAVRIKVSGDNACYGSGVITEIGVVTCAHLFTIGDTSTEITVESADEITSAMISKIDYETDIAILSCDWASKPACRLAENPSGVDDKVTSVGRDKTGVLTAEEHKVVGLAKYEVANEFLYLPPPYEGRSGGGLFNSAGELVGIVQAFDESNTGIAGSVSDIAYLARRKIGRRVLATEASYCLPCVQFHRKNKRGNDAVEIIPLRGDKDGWHRSKSISEVEFQMMLTEMKNGRTLPFAMWQAKTGKWYATEVGGMSTSDLEKWIEESDKPRKADK
jgi:hypothetical protein